MHANVAPSNLSASFLLLVEVKEEIKWPPGLKRLVTGLEMSSLPHIDPAYRDWVSTVRIPPTRTRKRLPMSFCQEHGLNAFLERFYKSLPRTVEVLRLEAPNDSPWANLPLLADDEASTSATSATSASSASSAGLKKGSSCLDLLPPSLHTLHVDLPYMCTPTAMERLPRRLKSLSLRNGSSNDGLGLCSADLLDALPPDLTHLTLDSTITPDLASHLPATLTELNKVFPRGFSPSDPAPACIRHWRILTTAGALHEHGFHPEVTELLAYSTKVTPQGLQQLTKCRELAIPHLRPEYFVLLPATLESLSLNYVGDILHWTWPPHLTTLTVISHSDSLQLSPSFWTNLPPMLTSLVLQGHYTLPRPSTETQTDDDVNLVRHYTPFFPPNFAGLPRGLLKLSLTATFSLEKINVPMITLKDDHLLTLPPALQALTFDWFKFSFSEAAIRSLPTSLYSLTLYPPTHQVSRLLRRALPLYLSLDAEAAEKQSKAWSLFDRGETPPKQTGKCDVM